MCKVATLLSRVFSMKMKRMITMVRGNSFMNWKTHHCRRGHASEKRGLQEYCLQHVHFQTCYDSLKQWSWFLFILHWIWSPDIFNLRTLGDL